MAWGITLMSMSTTPLSHPRGGALWHITAWWVGHTDMAAHQRHMQALTHVRHRKEMRPKAHMMMAMASRTKAVTSLMHTVGSSAGSW